MGLFGSGLQEADHAQRLAMKLNKEQRKRIAAEKEVDRLKKLCRELQREVEVFRSQKFGIHAVNIPKIRI